VPRDRGETARGIEVASVRGSGRRSDALPHAEGRLQDWGILVNQDQIGDPREDRSKREDRDEPSTKDPGRLNRRKFLAALAAAPAAAGVASILAAKGNAEEQSAPSAAPPGAKRPKVAAGGIQGRLRRLSSLKLPQGFDVEALTNDDMLRIADLVASGAPMQHGAFVGDLGPCPVPGQMFSDGEDCPEGTTFNCAQHGTSFHCDGGILDDFECYLGFECPQTFVCWWSFDGGTGAPGAGGEDCPTAFTCGAGTTFLQNDGHYRPVGGFGKAGDLDGGFSSGVTV